jgi:hypothetical protein
MVILDLGCGAKKRDGAVGTDICALPGVDVLCDLQHPPYPFATGCADQIHMSHVLEHLDDAVQALTEAWRISRDGGTVHVRVPHYTGRYAWKDPTHKRCFSLESFDYFGENPYSYYTPARLRVRSVSLTYLMEPPRSRVIRLWGKAVQWLVNRHPTFCERFVAYLVGGIDEIQVTLEARKDQRAVQPQY